MSEPAILVKRKRRGNQIWAMEKFENKIIDMRDMYEERKRLGLPMMVVEEYEDQDPESWVLNVVCPSALAVLRKSVPPTFIVRLLLN